MRYFFTIAYKGTRFHGWQKQPKAITVQQVVEEAFSTVLNTSVEIVGSGRTDAGVHAIGQVFQVDLPDALAVQDLRHKLNKILPKDVALTNAKAVLPESHARFDAVSRSYEYRITEDKNPFAIDLAYFYKLPLHVEAMNEAAKILLNHSDFESFSKVKTEVHTFNCEIFQAVWKQEPPGLVFHISANRFLRGMVRAIVGTLLEVGLERISPGDFNRIIEEKSRQSAGRAVPAQGLYLTSVKYPETIYKEQ